MAAGTRLLIGADGQPFAFDPGSFAVELLLTGAQGTETGAGRASAEGGGGLRAGARSVELLRSPADFVAWMLDSRLAFEAPLEFDQFDVRLAELRQLRAFRDMWVGVARRLVAGDRPTWEQLQLINARAETSVRPYLDPDTGQRAWSPVITGTEILGTAARDAIEVLGGWAHRLRECASPECSLLFVDTSRPGLRRWCSMTRCGNREKVRAYRHRQRD